MFFGHDRTVATTTGDEFDPIVDTDNFDTFRRTTTPKIPRMKLRSSRTSTPSHGADNPIEIDDSDDDRVPVPSVKVNELCFVD
jgi:hypothetical protein